jgi:hypothetical protein
VTQTHKVLCVDPGPHVGVATWTDHAVVDAGFEHAHYVEEHKAWETTPPEFYRAAAAWAEWADVIVCEGFVISGTRAKEANVTIEMIGVLRYLAALHSKRFVVQRPGAYKFAGTDKLKRLGWYTPGSDHARSASGHLVLYLAESGLIDAARLLPQ